MKFRFILFFLTIFTVNGCKTIDNAVNTSKNYMASMTNKVNINNAEIEPVEVYQNPKYGRNVRFSSLPLEHSIIKKNGNGSKKIAVMMDAYCPHSASLNKKLDKLEDTTIYIFVGPFLRGSKTHVAQLQNCKPNNSQKLMAYENAMNGIMPKNTPVSRACLKQQIKIYNTMLDVAKSSPGANKGATSPGGVPLIFLENDITLSGDSSVKDIKLASKY